MLILVYYEKEDEEAMYEVERSDCNDETITKNDMAVFLEAYILANDKFRYSYNFDIFLKHLGFCVSIETNSEVEEDFYVCIAE